MYLGRVMTTLQDTIRIESTRDTLGIHEGYMQDTCRIHAEYMQDTCGLHVSAVVRGYIQDIQIH